MNTHRVILSRTIFTTFCTLLCLMTPGLSNADTGFCTQDLSTLLGTWEIVEVKKQGDFEDEDVYTIETDGSDYFLRLNKSMTKRKHWKGHKKPKKIKLIERSRPGPGSDYCKLLCADGISGRHGLFGFFKKEHVIVFWPPDSTTKKSLVEEDEKSSAVTCDTLDQHGGIAHGQN